MHRHGVTWIAIFAIIVTMFIRLPPMVAKQDSVLNTYAAVVEVDALAKHNYVNSIDDDRLTHGAIRGMLFELDPYSAYMEPRDLMAYERRQSVSTGDLGVQVGMRRGLATVIAPIDGGPAARAGVLSGDVILAVDGEQTKGLSVFDIQTRFLGDPGTPVELTLRREGADDPITFVVNRALLNVETVRGLARDAEGNWDFLLDEELGIAYVRVTNFHPTTVREFNGVFDKLNDMPVRGLILDLRFNPGGLLSQAVALVDRFVRQGVIVSTATRRQAVRWYVAHDTDEDSDIPLSVLINHGTASAAEIVAGALQDHSRAVVVGNRSFGKGSVQHLIKLNTLPAAVKLTVAHYRLPGGRVIHRTGDNQFDDSWGVSPDVRVDLKKAEVVELQESRRFVDLDAEESDRSAAWGSPSKELVRDRQLLEATRQVVRQLALADSGAVAR